VYLLPGLMDYERSWIDKGHVNEQMDRLIRENRVGKMLIVMPDKDEAALNDGLAPAFADYLGRDLVGHIDVEYRTLPIRSHRGIEGLSLGAAWAMRMAIYYPDTYCSIGCLSGGFGDETAALLPLQRERLRRAGTRFRVGAGTGEPEFLQASQELVQLIRDLGFYCEFDLAAGPHDWPLWRAQVYNSLQFHYYSFNPIRAA